MSIYKIPIVTAFAFFPLLAFIFTLPFLIYQYRKYGSIPFLRSVIFYSFVLYLLCTYFLIILPLPSVEEVKRLTSPTMQLVPFDFVRDLLTISFNWKDITSYLSIIQNPPFYIVIFNILLTIPFGLYLRYYFECKWYKILVYGFLLSLFFELTQLTGLYGIYPRPYRLFDVDDLILNTAGAMIGCMLSPLLLKVLPTRKELDKKSFIKGKQVTLFRRILSFCIDLFFWIIIAATISIISWVHTIYKYSLLISLLICFLIIPALTNGKTLGKMILKLKISSKKENKWAKIKVLSRYILSYILFYYQFVITGLIETIPKSNQLPSTILSGSIILLRIYLCLNIFSIVYCIFTGNKLFLYEKITNTENISTIEVRESTETGEENDKES